VLLLGLLGNFHHLARAMPWPRLGGNNIMIGLRELAILAAVVLVLYGRTGVLKSRRFQTIWPWISPQRRTTRPVESLRPGAASRAQSTARTGRARRASRAKSKLFVLRGNRLFWFLTILAATAVAAIIVGRMMIASGLGPGLSQ
jgi:hypothetical protein